MSPPPAPPDDFLALQEALAGRYSLERELGRGGMGVVYLAQDVALDRPVALKLLPTAFAAQPVLRERFIREARTAAKLSHPNIVPIHLVDEVGDFVFFVMAFVEGETLGERVRRRGPVPPREAARILREVSWALGYAHAQGVVHRDIKPDNILLEAGSGRAMVTDFGIAHVGEAVGLTAVGEILGTPEYMSPEQASGEDVDGRTDLYALGIVGHFMLSGTLPFQGKNAQATLAKQLTQEAPALATVAPETPRGLAEVLDRCLEKDPAARVQDGAALADELGRVLQDRKKIPTAIRVFVERNQESTTLLAAISMMIVMTFAVGLILWSDGDVRLLEILLPMLGGSSMWLLVPAGVLGANARRLLKSGYDHDEMLLALRSDVEERRRELRAEVGNEDGAVDVWAPRVAVGAFAVFLVAMFAILLPGVPEALLGPLLMVSCVIATVSTLVAGARHALRKSVPGERWLAFWDSAPGRALFGLSGLGAGPTAARGGSVRRTEAAIGMAAERLYEELPKDVRRSLGDVPGVIAALESHAESMRARLKDLDRVLGDIGDRGTTAGSVAATTAAGVGGKRGSVAAEVQTARDAAEGRLRDVVAALENIRLELLRLHAGSGTVESMTADLTAARALAEDMTRLGEARAEVNVLLARPVITPPEPDTPVPA